MANDNGCLSIFLRLIQVFCGDSSNNNNNQQQQQQQQQQTQQQYPQQQQQQQQQYQHQQYPQQQQQQYPQPHQPHQQFPQQQQHNAYPPQTAWNQAAHPQSPSTPHGHQNHNQDQVNASNPQYVNLRNQARHEGDLAHQAFAASQQAYQSGDGARAHELSTQGKQHQQRKEQLDDQAQNWIFTENNEQSQAGTIDLHGLYVKEAIEETEKAIQNAQGQGLTTLRVIVGKGIHSQGHVAKIKPAVEDLMVRYNLTAHIDPSNTGVLLVNLKGQQGGGRSRDAGGLVDKIGEGNQDCVIM
ncbi:hypothetical protein P7C73_g4596, partial [Tremellales sp. Uapishka_1]